MRVSKVLVIITTIMTMMFFTSCSKEDTTISDNGSVINTGIVPTKAEDGIDVDLTQLSSTMLYSEVYNMVMYPDEYIGKVVKAEGYFNVSTNTNTGKKYFMVQIDDAEACCSQGMEFELEGDYSYPEDYPEVGTDITVIGTFNTYIENEYTFINLENATLEIQ